MKKVFIILSFLFLISSVSLAQKSGFGVGIIIGEPTGLSIKKFIIADQAIDAAIAWSFKKQPSFHIHADYIFHNYNLIYPEQGKMAFYYGIGGRIRFSDEPEIGVRIPLGLTYEFNSIPLDIFMEMVPIFNLVPATSLSFAAAIGTRYYFY